MKIAIFSKFKCTILKNGVNKQLLNVTKRFIKQNFQPI